MTAFSEVSSSGGGAGEEVGELMEGVSRPKALVLPESATVPDRNLIVPAPNQFTHELTRPQPYYFTSAQEAASPNGMFPSGTKVVLLVRDGGSCRVADRQGLYVEVDCGSLRDLR
jgi:hypothetical protein